MQKSEDRDRKNIKEAKIEVGFPILEVQKSEGGRWDTDDKLRFKSMQIVWLRSCGGDIP